MTDIAVLDRDTVSDLLGSRSNPFLNYEENRHARGISRSMVFERPLEKHVVILEMRCVYSAH